MKTLLRKNRKSKIYGSFSKVIFASDSAIIDYWCSCVNYSYTIHMYNERYYSFIVNIGHRCIYKFTTHGFYSSSLLGP